jgi:hypothetical protein
MDELNYFALRVEGGHTGDQMNYYAYKGDIYLSPHTKAVSPEKAAHLATRDLAERAAAALAPIARKRYGDAARIVVVPVCTFGGGKLSMARTAARIKADTEMLEARIAQGVFAPNKRPSMSRL